MNKLLAINARAYRELRHWTQQHLADTADIQLRTVQRVEKGEGASAETLSALACAFDTTIDALHTDWMALVLRDQEIELQKTHHIVPVTPIARVADLEIVGATEAYLMHCTADDGAVRKTSAELQSHLTDLRDIWNDVGAVEREEYLKEAFAFVAVLKEQGYSVGFGTCMYAVGASKASELRTLCVVVWPRGQEQERVAIPK
jgi:transcriptional regulator with XRE-family HTH domain